MYSGLHDTFPLLRCAVLRSVLLGETTIASSGSTILSNRKTTEE